MRIDWIKRILVVGAGTMGHSIAMVFAQNGFETDLVDAEEEVLDKALKLIQSNLKTLREAKLIRSKAIPRILDRIHPSTSLNVGERADFVVEAISEDQRAKRELFRVLDRICPEKTIISSNTSYLNIFRFAKASRQEKMLIAHWYVPPHLIPLDRGDS
jgi:3-hydroxyacyl-CoA dehydrogenase